LTNLSKRCWWNEAIPDALWDMCHQTLQELYSPHTEQRRPRHCLCSSHQPFVDKVRG
jgi:hypothetical protein